MIQSLPESIKRTPADVALGILRRVLDTAPVAGPLINAALDFLPGSQLDRVARYVAFLEEQLERLHAKVEDIQRELASGQGPQKAALAVEACRLAARSDNDLLLSGLASIVAQALTGEDGNAPRLARLARTLMELEPDQINFLTKRACSGWVSQGVKTLRRGGVEPDREEWFDLDFQLMIAELRRSGLVEVQDVSTNEAKTDSGFVIWLTYAGAELRDRLLAAPAND